MATAAWTFVYPARLSEEADGRYTVTFPDVPEAITFGSDRENALANAVDALSTALAEYARRGLAAPRPSRPGPGQAMIAADAVIALKLALAEAMREQRIKKAALARRLGTDEKEVRRLLDPAHASKARRLADALRALGHSVEVSVS